MANPIVQLMAPLAVTTAITGSVVQASTPIRTLLSRQPRNLIILGKFTYGSGGTTFDFWVQTSFDGGTTWTDVCRFSGTTSNLAEYFNINTQTAQLAAVVQTDATLAANTEKDGTLGPLLRVKGTTTGTYAGGTTMEIDICGEPT